MPRSSFGAIVKKIRQKSKLSLEDISAKAKIHKSALNLIENGKRSPTIETAIKIASAINYPLAELISLTEDGTADELNTVTRRARADCIRNESALRKFTGLEGNDIIDAINLCYSTLDIIDVQLIKNQSPRLAELVELANLSSMIGNLLGTGLAKASNGLYKRNKPHTYPDLIPLKRPARELEIKIALETNKPKGHLPKAGRYITFRYVLAADTGKYIRGKESRGNFPLIWEVKVGILSINDFSISNTEGDSGKTAIIINEKFNEMPLVYYDKELVPYATEEYPGYN